LRSATRYSRQRDALQKVFHWILCGETRLMQFCLFVFFAGVLLSSWAQSQELPALQEISSTDNTSATNAPEQSLDQLAPGAITGTVEDQLGAVNAGATVRLIREGQSEGQEVQSGDNGQFSFSHIEPGPFRLKISGSGFVPQEVSGVLHPGEFYIVPRIMLAVSGGESEMRVNLSPVEVAQEQIKEQEKQRVFGIVPNFYVTYDPNPVPLNARQKFHLAWKSTTDPVTFIGVGMLAGFEQAADEYSGYGQGMQGYAKRYGAAYADVFAGTFIGSAVLPSVLKQDPRYFYRGIGSTRSRIGYAVANSVMCKGDNQRWQPNYSTIMGAFAAGGISYLYYPSSDRSAGLLVQNSLLKIAESSLAGIFQEFVVRRLTPRTRNQERSQP
jgi:Carboxypeptidase regulatory-like domain